jgi:hypothetical protein
MRLPRMTVRRWMILIAVAAVDCLLIVQRISDPLANVALVFAFAVVILSPAILILSMLAADDR